MGWNTVLRTTAASSKHAQNRRNVTRSLQPCRPPALTLDQVLQAVVHFGNAGLNDLGWCADRVPDRLTQAAAVLAQLAAALAQAVRDVSHRRLVGQGVGEGADLACESLQALANTLQQVGSHSTGCRGCLDSTGCGSQGVGYWASLETAEVCKRKAARLAVAPSHTATHRLQLAEPLSVPVGACCGSHQGRQAGCGGGDGLNHGLHSSRQGLAQLPGGIKACQVLKGTCRAHVFVVQPDKMGCSGGSCP